MYKCYEEKFCRRYIYAGELWHKIMAGTSNIFLGLLDRFAVAADSNIDGNCMENRQIDNLSDGQSLYSNRLYDSQLLTGRS